MLIPSGNNCRSHVHTHRDTVSVCISLFFPLTGLVVCTTRTPILNIQSPCDLTGAVSHGGKIYASSSIFCFFAREKETSSRRSFHPVIDRLPILSFHARDLEIRCLLPTSGPCPHITWPCENLLMSGPRIMTCACS